MNMFAECPKCEKLTPVSDFWYYLQLIGMPCTHCGHIFQVGEITYLHIREEVTAK